MQSSKFHHLLLSDGSQRTHQSVFSVNIVRNGYRLGEPLLDQQLDLTNARSIAGHVKVVGRLIVRCFIAKQVQFANATLSGKLNQLFVVQCSFEQETMLSS